MDKAEISKFIDKTISKTKKHELDWKAITNNNVLKPLPTEAKTLISNYFGESLCTNDSYISNFRTGSLVLLVFSSTVPSLLTPPDGCKLSLRIQDEKSKYAVEISNTSDDAFNAHELIRLYNLIDKDSPSIQTLIDDFLNS